MVFGLFKPKEEASVTRGTASTTTSNAAASSPGFGSVRGANVLVTGACGLVGARLVEMCLDRGAQTVLAVDLQNPDDVLQQRFGNSPKVNMATGPTQGDLTSTEAMEAAFGKLPRIDVVFHIGGLAGPFFDRDEYMRVNYQGTLKVIEMCKKYNVPKLV